MSAPEHQTRREKMSGPTRFPAMGCQIVLAIRPARRMDIAERLEPAIPAGWDLISEFHRERQHADGTMHDIYFHRVETHTDRVAIDTLLRFGDQFADIDQQLNIERVREDSPEVFEDAVESLGRERALEMFGDVGGSGAELVKLRAVPEASDSSVKGEVLLHVAFSGQQITQEDMDRAFMQEPFLGQLLRTERVNMSTWLVGGGPVRNIESVRETLDHLDRLYGVERDESLVVCRVFEDTSL